MSPVEELQQQIQKLNMLLDPIANAEVDINDPDWQKHLKEAPNPLDEAGIREPAEQATKAMLELFLHSNSKERSQIRRILSENDSFAWAMEAPVSTDPKIAFRDRVLLVLIDDAVDTRDVIMRVGDLVEEARSKNINYQPIIKRLTKVAGTTDHYGFGSMRSVLLRHC